MSREQSVALITSSLRLSGGVLVLVHFAVGLVERGYQVTIVTSRGGAEPQIRQLLPPQIKIPEATTSLEQAASMVGKLRLTWELAWLTPRCDTIIATHTPTVVPALMAQHLLRRGSRGVWFQQHHPCGFQGRPLEERLMRHAPGWFERVITVSDFNRQSIERISGVSAWTVPQGFSFSGSDVLPDRRTSPPISKTVLYMGDRRQRKGWDDFLAAANLLYQQHRDLRLTIITKEQGPVDTAVPYTLHYRPTWEEFVNLCHGCRVFVSASWWEGFGRPPLEAMACGIPVVTTDSGGVRDYAQDGVNCLMTPIRDPSALATAIDLVLTDDALAHRLAEAGPQTARKFTWQQAVEQFVHALESGRVR